MYELKRMPDNLLRHLFLILLLCTLNISGEAAETKYDFDRLGRLIFVEYPDGSAIGYGYDANGNRTTTYRGIAGAVGIQGFSPSSGIPGTTVTISGSGFDPVPNQNAVAFNGVPAVVNSATTTGLQVTVPANAQTGPVSVAAGGSSAVGPEPFVVHTPVITSFSPQFVNPADTVTIIGGNLNLDPGTTAFSIQGTVATLVSLSNDGADIVAPAVSGPIVVSTSYGQATSVGSLVVLPTSIDPADVVGLAPLDPGTSQHVSIGEPGKKVVFEFDAIANKRLAFRILSISTVPASSSVGYQLISPSGSVALSGTVSSSGPSTIEIPPQSEPGRYLMVFDSLSNTSVDMTAKVELYPELATNGSSLNYVGSIPGAPETFVFNATAGDDLGLGITNTSVSAGANIYLRVYRPSGGQWKFLNCHVSKDPGCSMDLRDVPETGEYALEIVPVASGALANYTLTLTHAVAGTLTLDTPQTVTLASPGQQALFEFTATAGQTVAVGMDSISTTPAGKWVDLRVYDASGTQLASAAGNGTAGLNLHDLAAGTYTVRVSPHDAATGSVQLLLASGLSAVLPSDGTSQSFAATSPNQHGFFTFNATAGDDLGLGITSTSVSAGANIYLRVYRPSGGQWKFLNCHVSRDPGCAMDLRDVPETGEYLLRVLPYASSALASYTLTLSNPVAGALTLGTPQTVTLASPGQQALFEFTATAGQNVAVGIDSISTTPAGERIDLKVYGPGSTLVGSTGGTSAATLNLTNLAAGTYTVWLSSPDAATGSTELLVE